MVNFKEAASQNEPLPSLMIEQKEGIKLTRNASGIYQWEIKSFGLDVNIVIEKDIEIRRELDKMGLKYEKELKVT